MGTNDVNEGTEGQERHLPRRVRIQGRPGDLRGYQVLLTDLDTGEIIRNMYSAIVVLDVESGNHAMLAGYQTEPDGRIIPTATGDLPVIQFAAQEPEVDVTVLAHTVTTPDETRVLKMFQALKEKPFIQFLTCYITLTLGWRFEDLADFHMAPTMVKRWQSIRGAWVCRFAFRNGKVETFGVVEIAKSIFEVDPHMRFSARHEEMHGDWR